MMQQWVDFLEKYKFTMGALLTGILSGIGWVRRTERRLYDAESEIRDLQEDNKQHEVLHTRVTVLQDRVSKLEGRTERSGGH